MQELSRSCSTKTSCSSSCLNGFGHRTGPDSSKTNAESTLLLGWSACDGHDKNFVFDYVIILLYIYYGFILLYC